MGGGASDGQLGGRRPGAAAGVTRGIRMKAFDLLQMTYSYLFSYFFPLIITFTSQLLDKPWSQVSSLVPPRYVPSFVSRIGFGIPAALQQCKTSAQYENRVFNPARVVQATEETFPYHKQPPPRHFKEGSSALFSRKMVDTLLCTRR